MSESSPAPAEQPKKAKSRPPFGRLLMLIIQLMAVPFVLAAVLVFMPGPLSQTQTVIIPRGAHAYDIAAELDKNGVTYNPFLFRIASKLLAKDSMKAGEYEFPAHISMADAVQMMHEGKSVVRMFTVAEGLTSAEVVKALDNLPLSGTVASIPADGSLLPETYRYSAADSRTALIARMEKSMQDTLNKLWAARDPAVPLKSPQEALIMASIVEKETAKKEERPRVAQVFYNRLQHSMRLQSDPTVIYALTKGKGPLDRALTHEDLAFASPYNTYASDGMPPAPICNPGRASIEAALHPEANEFLYFVADGTGGHVFSKDLTTHNVNVTKWNQVKTQQSQPMKAVAH